MLKSISCSAVRMRSLMIPWISSGFYTAPGLALPRTDWLATGIFGFVVPEWARSHGYRADSGRPRLSLNISSKITRMTVCVNNFIRLDL